MYKIIHVYDFNALGIFWKGIGAKLGKHQVQVLVSCQMIIYIIYLVNSHILLLCTLNILLNLRRKTQFWFVNI